MDQIGIETHLLHLNLANPKGFNWTRLELKLFRENAEEAKYAGFNWTRLELKLCFLTKPGDIKWGFNWTRLELKLSIVNFVLSAISALIGPDWN